MSYRLEFKINALPSSTNSIGRKHWAVKAREAREWKTLVAIMSKSKGLPTTPLKKAKLTLTRGSSVSPDADGLVSSFKHVIDGLVYAKVLENDRMDNIGMPDYRWEKAPQNNGWISVVVEEVG